MQELRTTGTFVQGQPGDDVLTAIVARSVLEAAQADETSSELWFEVGRSDDERTLRVAIDVSSSDLDEILRLSTDDDIAMSIDAEGIDSLFDEPDVEAHGLKLPIAVVVTGAAILAPAGHAAVTQGIGAAATTQRTSAAISAQAHVAARAEVVGVARTSPAVSAQVHPAAKAEVVGVASKTAVTKTLVVHANGFKLLRTRLFR